MQNNSFRPVVSFIPEAWVQIDTLKEHPKNPRVDLTQNREKFESLKRSILDGVFEPIKVSRKSGFCLAGHQRLKAFKELGYEEVPVQYNDCETEEEELKIIIKDNNEWGAYDYDQLNIVLQDLPDLNLEDMGFNDLDLKNIKLEEDMIRESKEDDVPEVPKEPKAKYGDIYLLGHNRLMCGDSTNLEDVEKLMDGVKADMVFTDPPYNVNYAGRGKNTSNTIKNDHMSEAHFDAFLDGVFKCYTFAAKKKAAFYVCHSSSSQIAFETAMNRHGLEVKNQIIWNKTIASMGWGDYRWKHEPIFYATFPGGKTDFYGDRCQYTVWDETWDDAKVKKVLKKMQERMNDANNTVWTLNRDSNYVHPTQKPIELIEKAIMNSSQPEELILDLFGDSGSTLIGAEKTNRFCYLMELDPKYVDVIIKRWEEYTGKKAEKITL